MDVMRQVMELLAVLIVARKQDDHTDHRILKNFDFFIRQTGSGDINYDCPRGRSTFSMVYSFSITTIAIADESVSLIET